MKVKLILISIFFAVNSSFAQFSVENYLSAPFHEAEITGLVKQKEFVENESFRSPWFRELEVRLRSNDFNLSPEDYRLRLGLMNPVEQRRNRKYKEVQSEYFESKYTFENNLLLAGRYKHLARHYYLSNYKTQLLTDLSLFKLSTEQFRSGINLKTVIDADEAMLKHELELAEINTSITLLEYIMQEIMGGESDIRWDGFEMISVDKMLEVLYNDSTSVPIEVLLARQSLKLDEQAYKIEKAEAWRNIGFLQAEYDTERGDDLSDHLGFQVGVLIPIFNPDKPELKREMLDLMESENRVQQKQEEAEFDKYSLDREFLENQAAYKMVSYRLETFEKLGRELDYENAEEYLALVKYLASLNALKNKYYLNCLNTYIELLALSGSLSEDPIMNYLSEDLEEIGN